MRKNTEIVTAPVYKKRAYNKNSAEWSKVQAYIRQDEKQRIKSYTESKGFKFGDWIANAIREQYKRETK